MFANDPEQALTALYTKIDSELKSQYDRSLSFQDGLFDRFLRAKRLQFGENASIYNSALVYGKVIVGENTWIGPYCILDGSGGGLTIGSFCSISAGVHIYTHDTVHWALSGGQKPKKESPVKIGDSSYIGAQSIIIAGIEIGSQCVVGANSFVNQSLPNNVIAVGNPARIIGEVITENNEIVLKYY